MTDRGADPSSAQPADGLTAEQRAIVDWEDGPLVVVAGAGTGKTRVIVERVRRLLETKGVGSAPHLVATRCGSRRRQQRPTAIGPSTARSCPSSSWS